MALPCRHPADTCLHVFTAADEPDNLRKRASERGCGQHEPYAGPAPIGGSSEKPRTTAIRYSGASTGRLKLALSLAWSPSAGDAADQSQR